MALNRVVVTGVGAVSPFGLGTKALLDAVWEGRSGVRLMEAWAGIGGLHSHLAAPVPPFDAKPLIPRAHRRTMGKMAMYATLAAQEAVADAGLASDVVTSGEVGAAIGSTTGSPETYQTFYEGFLPNNSVEGMRSGLFFQLMGHSCAANVCLALGIQGEQWAPSSACTSAAQSIGLGFLLVQSGRQRAMLCGGADEAHPSVTMVFDVVGAASRRHDPPLLTPRPFDAARDGVVCGGGSGILVLESLDSAVARGAEIRGEVLGFGHVNDSAHIANPHESSMARAMGNALRDAGIPADAVDYVNAHATGTDLGDVAEATAIRSVVGGEVPVSSFKGHLGHTLGAAGALETIVVLEMLRRQQVIPTLHLDHADPACAGVELPRSIAARSLHTVLKNNFALGGVNAALVLRRWSG